MIDIKEIEREIVKLENGNTTYDSCMKLAHLYIVRREYYKCHEVGEVETIIKEKEPVYQFGAETYQKDNGLMGVKGVLKKSAYDNEMNSGSAYGNEMNVSRETSVEPYSVVSDMKDTAFIKICKEKGIKKVLHILNEYLEHERVWKPVEYARIIDYLNDK